MASVDDIRRIVALDHGLASLATLRADGGVHMSVVNAGVIDHPADGTPTVAFVARPATRKLANLQERPQATLLWRAGWAWVAAEGMVEILYDDPAVLRRIYSASGGGEHDDWAEYDRIMAAEGRLAAMLRPNRIYLNP